MHSTHPIWRLVLLISFLLVFGQSQGAAQTSSHPDAASPLKENRYLRHLDPWRWDVRAQVFVRAGFDTYRIQGVRQEINSVWKLDDLEYIFPVIRQGGFYWTPNEDVVTSLRVNDTKYDPESDLLQTPSSETKYMWWRVEPGEERIHQLHFIQISHIVCADTKFDEKLAKQLPWPSAWPDEASRFLAPVIDRVDRPIEMEGQDRLMKLVDEWTEGQDPKTVDMVTLTKFLTGKVLEYVRVVRPRTIYAPMVHTNTAAPLLSIGFSTLSGSSWTGFDARSADRVALDPAGTEFDVALMLTAVLRSAGIPARTVVSFDNGSGTEISDRIVSIVEFALLDPESKQVLWIPIDTERLRDNGRRAHVYKQPWLYFGTHDQLHNMIPLGYYFHPPVNYKAFGGPGLYGIRTTPDIGNRATQIIAIDVLNTPIRGDDQKRLPSP